MKVRKNAKMTPAVRKKLVKRGLIEKHGVREVSEEMRTIRLSEFLNRYNRRRRQRGIGNTHTSPSTRGPGVKNVLATDT